MEKYGESASKRVLACICSIMMAMIMVPINAGFANASTTTDAAFLVYARDAVTGESALVKSWTDQELDSITKNYPIQSYLLKTSGGVTVYTAYRYVKISDLFSGISQWKSGAYIQFTCNGTTYTKSNPTYDAVTSSHYMFYPNYVYNSSSPEYSASSAASVPAILALDYNSALLADSQTAVNGVKINMRSSVYESDVPRFFMGNLDTDYEAKALGAGSTSPSGVSYATIIYPHSISGAKISIPDKTYSGKAQTVTATVKLGDTTLTAGTDYTCTPASVTKAGNYAVKIKGTGNYIGSISKTITVKLKKATPKITAGTSKMTVRYATTGASKYVIYYRVKGASTWLEKATKNTSLAIASLKKGKQYQVMVMSVKSGLASTKSSIVTSGKIG